MTNTWKNMARNTITSIRLVPFSWRFPNFSRSFQYFYRQTFTQKVENLAFAYFFIELRITEYPIFSIYMANFLKFSYRDQNFLTFVWLFLAVQISWLFQVFPDFLRSGRPVFVHAKDPACAQKPLNYLSFTAASSFSHTYLSIIQSFSWKLITSMFKSVSDCNNHSTRTNHSKNSPVTICTPLSSTF